MITEKVIRRFNKKWMPISDISCWIWIAAEDSNGCARLLVDYKNEKASRVSWQIHKGQIPDGLHVLHKCDNRLCVNPDHLFLGTHDDNMRDMTAKGRHFLKKRTHCKNGHLLEGYNLLPNLAYRVCRMCTNENYRKRYWKAKAIS